MFELWQQIQLKKKKKIPNILFVLQVDFISGRKQTRVESLDKGNFKTAGGNAEFSVLS